ncbi:hypothetical protein GFL03_22405 [Pseudomonas stutzeri]|uniref:hypothetical protein n=1 Tax=Stutzerimonas frequens TaxID=2968969 RepID=UPI00190C6A71|nr:hypothetical protein [Stutzerimonas frequens]MBK3920028.1 hypothetical protein [Stutzerimonas frequens]
MKISRTLPLVAALLLAGCDEGPQLPESLGQVEGAPTFRLPGPVYRLETTRSESRRNQSDHIFRKSDWEANGWSLWVAANVYSSAVRPGDSSSWDSTWEKAKNAKERSIADGNFLAGVKAFAKANNLPLELNYLGYDGVPMALLSGWESSRGMFFSWSGTACEFAFNRCVDNYFMSPVDRLSGGDHLPFKKWVEPFFRFPEGDAGIAPRQNFERKGGLAGEASEFFDWWPTMVFLVNPNGEVVRAWLPQTGNTASVGRVVAGIAEEMEIDSPIVAKDEIGLMKQPAVASYFGDYFIEAGVGRLIQTLNRLSEE